MKEEFTPGPWKVNVIGQHWNNESLTHLEVTFGDDGECVCDTVYQRGDANLISAAPELISVLKKIVESGHILTHLKIESQWAIAKALGESQ
ncbi:hypothetical protein QLG07_02535 [Erwinia sp. V90_4]|uniref:hypothetical protein n=1 Tax=Erwinia sp. V90_4 TaxID=3044239 RepID=UPI00249F047D|nr:hypothetical protein [Erwinia sp. V90_4]MDI3438335.1 hypothetical protein [Erwinia sp. V90_4]